MWDLQSIKPAVSLASEACIVFLNQFRSETVDIPALADADSDTLVANVAKSCENTIVVIHNAWIRNVDAWIENPNVTAVIYAHYPGQESGAALVDVLYGIQSPSGRLPYTVPKNDSDYGSLLYPANTTNSNGSVHAIFTEGNNIDYRHFQANNIEPRFPFGFGLTYTTFGYSSVSAKWVTDNRPVAPPAPEVKVPGGIESLFGVLAEVSACVSNNGSVAAAEVAQLYIAYPGETVTYLRGFTKPFIYPSNTAEVEFSLTRRDLSRWDVVSQTWQLQTGEYKFFVGPNVRDATLVATLTQ